MLLGAGSLQLSPELFAVLLSPFRDKFSSLGSVKKGKLRADALQQSLQHWLYQALFVPGAAAVKAELGLFLALEVPPELPALL